MRGSISRIARRRKASSAIPRKRVWSGSSIVSMLVASVRQTRILGEKMGNYVKATTTESDESDSKKPGAINWRPSLIRCVNAKGSACPSLNSAFTIYSDPQRLAHLHDWWPVIDKH